MRMRYSLQRLQYTSELLEPGRPPYERSTASSIQRLCPSLYRYAQQAAIHTLRRAAEELYVTMGRLECQRRATRTPNLIQDLSTNRKSASPRITSPHHMKVIARTYCIRTSTLLHAGDTIGQQVYCIPHPFVLFSLSPCSTPLYSST